MPTESPYPPVEIPNVDIWTLLFERKDRDFPVVYRDSQSNRSYTYDEVRSTAVEFGQGLKDNWDWRKGHVLALYAPNSIDIPPVIWGCHWAGGIVSPANPTYNVEELAFQLKDAGAKGLATHMACLETARAAAKEVGLPESRIVLIGDARDESRRIRHFQSMKNLSGVTRYRRTKIDPGKDLAFLVYSSGTTGYPKGVMLNHTNVVSNILMLTVTEARQLSWDGGRDGAGDRALAFLPFFHIYGLTCILHTGIYVGLEVVVMAKFDLPAFCHAIQHSRITFAYVVPPVVLLLAKHPIVANYDFSSLRMMSSGAAPLTRDLVDAAYRRLQIPIKQGYGLSETSPVTHVQGWDEWDKPVGSVGRLLPNQRSKFISPDGAEVAAGETGELCVAGPNVFLGYLNKPETTKHAFLPDGYFRTGDVGHQDAEGNFFITDRVKELIKYKGFQVAPAELEGLLVTHPKIVDVTVVGVYDASLASEVPRAYVVPAPGASSVDSFRPPPPPSPPAPTTTASAPPTSSQQQSSPSSLSLSSSSPAPATAPAATAAASPTTARRDAALEREIVQWLDGRVANHKKLRGGVRFIDQVPRSAAGKILRRALKVLAEKETADLKPKL